MAEVQRYECFLRLGGEGPEPDWEAEMEEFKGGDWVLYVDHKGVENDRDQLKKDMDRLLAAVLDMSTDLVVTKGKLGALYELAEELEAGRKEKTDG